jgi:GxxExxY protein
MNINDISYLIRGAAFEVFKTLGPGLLESVYEKALVFELISKNLHVQTQVGIPVMYKGQDLDLGFRMDILVEDKVIIEVRSVELLHDVHKKQLLTYLKLADKKLGILINFNTDSLLDKESLIRIIN